jgi:hypothetical protein
MHAPSSLSSAHNFNDRRCKQCVWQTNDAMKREKSPPDALEPAMRVFQIRLDWYEEYWLRPKTSSSPAQSKMALDCARFHVVLRRRQRGGPMTYAPTELIGLADCEPSHNVGRRNAIGSCAIE